MFVRTQEDIDHHLELVRKAADDARAWIVKQTGDPLVMLRQMKFEAVGYHPIDGRPLNLVEQINQTWTYLVALARRETVVDVAPRRRRLPAGTRSVRLRAARYHEWS